MKRYTILSFLILGCIFCFAQTSDSPFFQTKWVKKTIEKQPLDNKQHYDKYSSTYRCPVEASIDSREQEVCQGKSLFFSFSGTNATSYSWTVGTNTTVLSTDDFLNHTFDQAGSISVNLVASDGNCESEASIIITVHSKPDIFNLSLTDATCYNDNGGAIVEYSGGTPPVYIEWSNGATSTTNSDLEVGNYWVRVHDNNCSSNQINFTISDDQSNCVYSDLLCPNNGDLAINGTSIDITNLRIKNEGLGVSKSCEILYYLSLSPNPTIDNIKYFLGSGDIEALASGEVSEQVFSIDLETLELSPEDYYVAYFIDYGNVNVETNKDNNNGFWIDQKINIPSTDCNNVRQYFYDFFESYNEGDITLQSDHWSTSPNATVGGIVSKAEPESNNQSIKISTEISDQNAIVLLGNKLEGHYQISFAMYIPLGKDAYFNLQHREAPGIVASELFFRGNADSYVNTMGEGFQYFTYPNDEWFFVRLNIDIDNNITQLSVNNRHVSSWTFSNGNQTLNQLGAVNFFPATNNEYYIDDLRYLELPIAEEPYYCQTAQELSTTGTFTASNFKCFGGHYLRRYNLDGERAAWYQWTANQDGVLSVSSCNRGEDTRVWIYEGANCNQLSLIGVNDDACVISSGDNPFASYREAYVYSGQTYYIMWDNIWSDNSFDFDLSFSSTNDTPNDMCHTATSLTAGEEVTIDNIDGNSAVAGFVLEVISGSTPMVQSEWYQYTATQDGTITVSSCQSEGVDTRVAIYTGNCDSFNELNLEVFEASGCSEGGVEASATLNVTAGMTYYIEWDNGQRANSFMFTLDFQEVVPIELLDFQVSRFNNDAVLHWSVANEINFSHYIIQRSTDVQIWEDIGSKEGSYEKNYQQLDVGAITSFSKYRQIYYRLKMFDQDGSITYSPIRSLLMESEDKRMPLLYPNPTEGLITIEFGKIVNFGTLELINLNGQIVRNWKLSDMLVPQQFDVTELPKGLYLIKYHADQTEWSERLIIK